MKEAAVVHIPVLAKEVPELLVRNPDGLYVDGTFGRGGHSRLILERLSPAGRLIAFDRDEAAEKEAASITDPRFTFIRSPFAEMRERLLERGISEADGVFLDIGVSSPQIDTPERGFSFRFDGPLDMRMDQSCGITAAEWLAQADEGEIARVIREFGEEKFASKIARAIVKKRAEAPIATTRELAALVADTVPRSRGDAQQHPATRTFQAIRIHVNRELDQLKEALQAAGSLLKEGGILAVISFHSLEDRIVKNFFADAANPAKNIDPRIPLLPHQMPRPLFERAERVLPGDEEKERNPRARSSVLRAALRTDAPWRDAQ
jgi:16S rRNA (cytosine1402-N4)-methyltransferase